MRSPALIFDFGNVIAFFDYAKAAAALAVPRGIAGPDLMDRLRDAGLDAWVKRYESGAILATDFSREIARLGDLDASHEEVAAAWAGIFAENPTIPPLISALKSAGYSLIMGSNTNDIHADRFRRQFAATLAHFDAMVLSYEIGAAKPSPEFYHACARAAGRLPSDCLFIDDLVENVEGARRAGLRALLYRGTPALVADLARLGVTTSAD